MIWGVTSIIDDVSSGQWAKVATEILFIVAALWEARPSGSAPTLGQRPRNDLGKPPAQ